MRTIFLYIIKRALMLLFFSNILRVIFSAACLEPKTGGQPPSFQSISSLKYSYALAYLTEEEQHKYFYGTVISLQKPHFEDDVSSRVCA